MRVEIVMATRGLDRATPAKLKRSEVEPRRNVKQQVNSFLKILAEEYNGADDRATCICVFILINFDDYVGGCDPLTSHELCGT